MSDLTDLPNIGENTKQQLNMVGINTYEELVSCGSREAWLRIKEIDSSACVNRLMGLEGAIQNIRWHHLPDDDKKALKDFFIEHKRGKSANTHSAMED